MFSLKKKIRSKVYSIVFNKTPLGEVLTMLHSLVLHLRFSFSNRNPGLEKERLEYYLVKQCHIVEKGLALPEPRKAFGQPKIKTLIKRTREYEKLYSETHIGLMVRDTLREYLEFHADNLQELPNHFLENMKTFIEEKSEQAKGGLKHLIKSEMVTFGGDKFRDFVKCRHSIRNFSDVPVEDANIMEALSIARHTPSVCNRQGWFAHYYSDKSKIYELLSYQNGNAGFTESIDKLLIVTGSTKAFTRYEHNQLFIDGGLYSMNLMLALHAVGLGACPLNTCMPWLKAKQMKKVAGIALHERIIMMIAVGNLLDEFSVAQSEKYSVEKILRRH
ncbi:nitroreductase family protein [Stutzerimonas stutzeri]|uniref:nitroreductase family protein n=1 Tax=Stutzerimonas stutzeri TaxID=316 RepID=UPI0015E2F293|nr:nitroreductase family protein [Stutzerimonas stutzeri]MBA1277430.1 nitroreductase family protein [Stutzerimonas stutzeri]